MQKDEHVCLSLTPQVQQQLHVERGSSHGGQPTVSRQWPPLGGPDPVARETTCLAGRTHTVRAHTEAMWEDDRPAVTQRRAYTALRIAASRVAGPH